MHRLKPALRTDRLKPALHAGGGHLDFVLWRRLQAKYARRLLNRNGCPVLPSELRGNICQLLPMPRWSEAAGAFQLEGIDRRGPLDASQPGAIRRELQLRPHSRSRRAFAFSLSLSEPGGHTRGECESGTLPGTRVTAAMARTVPRSDSVTMRMTRRRCIIPSIASEGTSLPVALGALRPSPGFFVYSSVTSFYLLGSYYNLHLPAFSWVPIGSVWFAALYWFWLETRSVHPQTA